MLILYLAVLVSLFYSPSLFIMLTWTALNQ